MLHTVLRNVFLLGAFALPLVGHAAQRSFVATSGSDANTASNCSNAAPCRGFAAALSVTDPGGEIIVLNSGGYGPVSIAQSVSIIAPEGVYAGVSVFSGNGVSILGANVRVTLRGLNINGLGGISGVSMVAGSSLAVERCTISNMVGHGLSVNTPASVSVRGSRFIANGQRGAYFASGASASVIGSDLQANQGGGLEAASIGASTLTRVVVSDTTARGNGGTNMDAYAQLSGTARLEVTNSVLSESSAGISAYSNGGTVRVSVANSLISGNTAQGLATSGVGANLVASGNLITRNLVGLKQEMGAVLESDGSNAVRGNTTETMGSISSFTRS